MIEIQCTSCQTRYRIDERILPEDTPTFKCSRCGHVFSAEPRQKPPRRASAASARAAGAPAKAAPGSADATPEPPSSPSSASPPPPDDSPATVSAAGAAAPAAETAPEESAAPQPRPKSPSVAEGAPEAPAAQPSRAAAQPQRAAPAPQPEEPTAPPQGTRELLQRRFGDLVSDEAEKPGENLAFDFNDEPRTPDLSAGSYAEEKWEVGDTDVAPPSPPLRPKRRIRISDIDNDLDEEPALDQPFVGAQAGERSLEGDEEQDFDRIRPEEVSAQAHRLETELRGRSYKLHSAGYFIGLFALVIFGFGIVTIAIQSAPVASAGLLSTLPIVGEGLQPPISAARRVALSEVQAQYASLKGNQTALVISGTAENLTASPLGAVQVEAALTASSPQPLRSQAVYCGNSLSSKMLGEMTPHEIEFFEKLDAPKSFTLAPQASAAFVIVFIEPPAGAVHFELRVVRADPAAAPAPAAEGG